MDKHPRPWKVEEDTADMWAAPLSFRVHDANGVPLTDHMEREDAEAFAAGCYPIVSS